MVECRVQAVESSALSDISLTTAFTSHQLAYMQLMHHRKSCALHGHMHHQIISDLRTIGSWVISSDVMTLRS